jgi:hypothetical protein
MGANAVASEEALAEGRILAVAWAKPGPHPELGFEQGARYYHWIDKYQGNWRLVAIKQGSLKRKLIGRVIFEDHSHQPDPPSVAHCKNESRKACFIDSNEQQKMSPAPWAEPTSPAPPIAAAKSQAWIWCALAGCCRSTS